MPIVFPPSCNQHDQPHSETGSKTDKTLSGICDTEDHGSYYQADSYHDEADPGLFTKYFPVFRFNLINMIIVKQVDLFLCPQQQTQNGNRDACCSSDKNTDYSTKLSSHQLHRTADTAVLCGHGIIEFAAEPLHRLEHTKNSGIGSDLLLRDIPGDFRCIPAGILIAQHNVSQR